MDSLRRWRASAVPASQDGLRPLDWPGLCARLSATRQLRRALTETGAEAEPARRSGSFDPAVAETVGAAGKSVMIVNPAASGSRNGAGDITGVVTQPRSD